jgi:hypothetical protein
MDISATFREEHNRDPDMQFNTCRSILKLECEAIVKMLNCEFQIGTEL